LVKNDIILLQTVAKLRCINLRAIFGPLCMSGFLGFLNDDAEMRVMLYILVTTWFIR